MTRRARSVAAATAAGLVLAVGTSAAATTEPTEPTDTTAASDTTEGSGDTASTEAATATDGTATGDNTSGAGWTVNTDDCIDPDAANAPIEGTIQLGSSMPLSGGPAATAYAPFADGLNAYVTYANENEIVPDHDIALTIGDDQFNPALTPGVVNDLLDQGVVAFTGIIGSAPNLAVRELLNEECVPQMFGQSGAPTWGEFADTPWSFGGLIPYDIESAAYATNIEEAFPDGATAAVFYVNIEFGQILGGAFEDVAPDHGIDVVTTQTIEATETGPPTAQVQAIAAEQPETIFAVPLGAQCPVFLTELANAMAATPGWEPQVYITNTCASKQILGAAGDAANGVHSSASAGLRDPDDPEQQEVPEVQTYIEAMQAGGYPETSISVGAAGWNVMEVTVEILRQAAESDSGLTRAAIINAARNLEYHPSMTRDGVVYRMAGEEDGWYTEDVQIVTYDAATQTFDEGGELITSYRYSE